MRVCCAFGCFNAKSKDNCRGKTFFFFPLKNPGLVKQWIVKIKLSNFKPTTNSVICSDHFEEDCFIYQPFTKRRMLKKGSVPTKFIFSKVPNPRREIKKFLQAPAKSALADSKIGDELDHSSTQGFDQSIMSLADSEIGDKLDPSSTQGICSESNMKTCQKTHLPKVDKDSHSPVLEAKERKGCAAQNSKIAPVENNSECEDCGKLFISSDKLKIHQCTHTGKKPFNCEICTKTFKDKHQLRCHMMIHKEKFKCEFCNHCFVTPHKLKLHTFTHTGERPIACDVCGKGFIKNSDLKNHIKHVHEGEIYKCDQCEMDFTTKGNLKGHKLIHIKEKPHKCDCCEKTFRRRAELIRHLRVHTNEKPYSCDVCQKCFTQSFKLKTHMTTHTKVRRFQCKVCDAGFNAKYLITKHMARFHSPFKCDVCNEGFVSEELLNQHTLENCTVDHNYETSVMDDDSLKKEIF